MVGAGIVHSDGVDFVLLEPLWLAIGPVPRDPCPLRRPAHRRRRTLAPRRQLGSPRSAPSRRATPAAPDPAGTTAGRHGRPVGAERRTAPPRPVPGCARTPGTAVGSPVPGWPSCSWSPWSTSSGRRPSWPARRRQPHSAADGAQSARGGNRADTGAPARRGWVASRRWRCWSRRSTAAGLVVAAFVLPVYDSDSSSSSGETSQASETLVDVNGLSVALVLAVPLLVTLAVGCALCAALALVAADRLDAHRTARRRQPARHAVRRHLRPAGHGRARPGLCQVTAPGTPTGGASPAAVGELLTP